MGAQLEGSPEFPGRLSVDQQGNCPPELGQGLHICPAGKLHFHSMSTLTNRPCCWPRSSQRLALASGFPAIYCSLCPVRTMLKTQVLRTQSSNVNQSSGLPLPPHSFVCSFTRSSLCQINIQYVLHLWKASGRLTVGLSSAFWMLLFYSMSLP